MDFTDRLAYSGPQPVFSPNRRLLASADGYRLVVRAADSLAVVALCSCLDRIENIAWSPDSDHLLCGLFHRATVQVFCVSGRCRAGVWLVGRQVGERWGGAWAGWDRAWPGGKSGGLAASLVDGMPNFNC